MTIRSFLGLLLAVAVGALIGLLMTPTFKPCVECSQAEEFRMAYEQYTSNYVARMESSTNAILVKDSRITTGDLWKCYGTNKERFVLIIGCTIDTGPLNVETPIHSIEIGTNGWEASIWIEQASTYPDGVRNPFLK